AGSRRSSGGLRHGGEAGGALAAGGLRPAGLRRWRNPFSPASREAPAAVDCLGSGNPSSVPSAILSAPSGGAERSGVRRAHLSAPNEGPRGVEI
ncbi:unnamed protein product, partial [Urochloa humidicola]